MKTAVFLLLAAAGWAQPLRVYSEFARIDATGKVTAPAEPREILSPAIVRNGYSSFQVVVDVPKGTPYQLYVAQNPENSVVVTLYQANGDKLEPVTQPASGDATQVFWMDLWTARDAPVARIKVEPQLHVNNDWVIYPMEGRVMSATVPDGGKKEFLDFCKLTDPTLKARSGDGSATSLHFRNLEQDIALASTAPERKFFIRCDASPTDPESPLRTRDDLLRLR